MGIRTVGEAFADLLGSIEPREAEVDALRAHRTTIEQALKSEFAHFNRVEPFGSHRKGTAIRTHSDVDYLAVLGRLDITWGSGTVSSSTTLGRLKACLEARFPRTPVRIDGPAAVVDFGNGAVDVVPGVWSRTIDDGDGYPVFNIPDGEGGWLESSPQRYAKYFRDQDARAVSKLGRTLRLLKNWKYARAPKVPVSGYHLELVLASHDVCVGAKSYQNCVHDAFALLRDRAGQALNDPLGISPRIAAAPTAIQRERFVEAARYAADHAARAIEAEIRGEDDEAFRQWKLVFNDAFPSRRY